MKTKQSVVALYIIATSFLGATKAQNYQPISLTGFNQDVIANGIGPALFSTTASIDEANFALVSRDYQLTNTSTPLTFGLPTNGTINSAVTSTPGLSYQLASYSSNNALKLNTNESGILNFSTPKAAQNLYMLATAGNGTSTVNLTIRFSDTSTQVFPGIQIQDWYDGSNYAIADLGRVSITNDQLEPSIARLQQIPLNIALANQSKLIESISITKTTGGIANLFAFSAESYAPCLAPSNIMIIPNGSNALVNWTAPTDSPSSGYDYYYNTSSTAPNDSTIPTGTVPSGTTSVNLTGLTINQTYYFWVRSNCGSTKGLWQMKQFTSGKIIATYTAGDINTLLNFFPSTTSINTCPGSLSITIPTGYKIKSTDVSYSMTAVSSGWIVDQYSILVCLNNNTAEAAVSAGVGLSAGTFLYNRSGLSIANGLTGTVNFELRAWRTFGGSACDTSYNKVDNNSFKITVTLEPDTVLDTTETNAKNTTTVYPNPFTDIVNVSNVENVKSISISDASGRLVKTFEKAKSALHVSDLKQGIYFITLKMNDGTNQTIKAIKK